jgi:NAD(P)-dependent dehydrogenase (short-subunit alcohol dehydrogenase family)
MFHGSSSVGAGGDAMDDFRGKLAVITGAGSGMGRELALQLVGAGAHVALCDVFADTRSATRGACEAAAKHGARISTRVCDVSKEADVVAFRDAVVRDHGSDRVNLLFNNAGTAGGGSFVLDDRSRWERTFNVNWFGVYHCTRAFLPLLVASSEACIINTSSVNGFFAYGPGGPSTAYSASKFAVKGFSEALLSDLRLNAPHVHLVLVMPGHIGTAIVHNTMRSQHEADQALLLQDFANARKNLERSGVSLEGMSEEQVLALLQQRADAFRDKAPVSAAQAATIMLDAVKQKRWRVLIGQDAALLDRGVREHPDEIYEPEFMRNLLAPLMPK